MKARMSFVAAIVLASCATAQTQDGASYYYCPTINGNLAGGLTRLEAQAVFIEEPYQLGANPAEVRFVWWGEDCGDEAFFCVRLISSGSGRAFSIVAPRSVRANSEFDFGKLHGVARHALGEKSSRHSISVVTWEPQSDSTQHRLAFTVQSGKGITSISGIPFNDNSDVTCVLESPSGFFPNIRTLGLEHTDDPIL